MLNEFGCPKIAKKLRENTHTFKATLKKALT